MEKKEMARKPTQPEQIKRKTEVYPQTSQERQEDKDSQQ